MLPLSISLCFTFRRKGVALPSRSFFRRDYMWKRRGLSFMLHILLNRASSIYFCLGVVGSDFLGWPWNIRFTRTSSLCFWSALFSWTLISLDFN